MRPSFAVTFFDRLSGAVTPTVTSTAPVSSPEKRATITSSAAVAKYSRVWRTPSASYDTPATASAMSRYRR